MPSLTFAAQLLSKCSAVGNLPPLLEALGFSPTIAPLTSDVERALDLPQSVQEVRISRGTGSLRALCFEIKGADCRESMRLVAARLNARAPQFLWLLIGIGKALDQVAIAAFSEERPKPRVAALVAHRAAIVDSDGETVASLAAADCDSDVLTHTRWLEILGRETVSRRFFHDLERLVGQLAVSLEPVRRPDESSELALLYVSRLLFLSFLETKGWLDRDHGFLANRFADCMVKGGGYHRRVLNPLFFGTLNTHPGRRAKRARDFGRVPFLNGGLFAKTPLEKRIGSSLFDDEALGDLFGDLLSRYRFTAREDARTWTEAAIDPEMLGKAFESLMAPGDRKRSGAFYTPQSLVASMTRRALACSLESRDTPSDAVDSVLAGEIPRPRMRTFLLGKLDNIRVLDASCGSGAFLVHALEEIGALYVRLGSLERTHVIRRNVLTRSIYGVDINPVAVWLCELRLWLAMSIDDPETDPMKVTPLPNLDRNIRVGDSLAGEPFGDRVALRIGSRITKVRARYARATGPRKRSLARNLDSLERECAIAAAERRIEIARHRRREMLIMLRSPDLFGERRAPEASIAADLRALKAELVAARASLHRLRQGSALPFSFSSGFADAAADGGFEVVLGNPPWVRTHNLDGASRKELRQRFSVYRNSAWLAGSEAANAGRGFASQADASALFVERCSDLLAPGGTLALVLPSKLWRSLAGGGVRSLVLDRLRVREIQDLTGSTDLFEAAVYPSVLVASRPSGEPSCSKDTCVRALTRGQRNEHRFNIRSNALSFDESPGSPWLIVPENVRAAFESLRQLGVPLSTSSLGRPLLGVKTGCNDAFIVRDDTVVESQMLRPVIRGERLGPWTISPSDERIIWTHNDSGPLKRLPESAARHLAPWRRTLELRADARASSRWWSLFRTESADSSSARVIWSDIGKRPRAAVIAAGDRSVPLNTCYVVRCNRIEDAETLAALLNSPLAAAWLELLAEPARGGYWRYMGWTIALFPVPAQWEAARQILAPVARQASNGVPPSDEALLDSVLRAYGADVSTLAPLLQWSA